MAVRQFSPALSGSAAPSALRMFESATAEVLAQPNRLPERATLYVLAGLVTTIIVFISVFKLDRIVKAQIGRAHV